MSGTIAVLNAGSSSIKFSLYRAEPEAAAEGAAGTDRAGRAGAWLKILAEGAIEELDGAPRFLVRDRQGAVLSSRRWDGVPRPPHEELLRHLIGWIESHHGPGALRAIGHRVVFGGPIAEPALRVDAAALDRLSALVPMMPLHLPQNLAPIRALADTHPGLPQIACFDTAFHASVPHRDRLYALPRALADAGLIRYGFHGLSYESIAQRLPALDPRAAAGRTIVAHLGNGASCCALAAGRSVGTTMGFSVLDGLVMGTRPGWIDPGILLYLLRQPGWDVDRIERLLYHESGLLGVSGISSDMRDLLGREEPTAQEAVDLFCRRAVAAIGSLVAPLGGLDALVFTGGIGEHAELVRREICAALRWLGVDLDEEANRRGGPSLHRDASPVRIWVLPCDEDRVIAQHALRILGAP